MRKEEYKRKQVIHEKIEGVSMASPRIALQPAYDEIVKRNKRRKEEGEGVGKGKGKGCGAGLAKGHGSPIV